MKRMALPLVTALLLTGLVGCTSPNSEYVEQAAISKEPAARENKPDPLSPQVAAREAFLNKNLTLPVMTVYKSPTCGCCKLWVEQMETSGFKVSVIETEDLNPIKLKLGVPKNLGSCHTAKVGDYFVEGHVPASDIKRLLKEKPDALGISVPGMPIGSPGMEVPSGETQPYTVTMVNKDGSLSIFSSH
jgi:hypothetical protein